MDNMVYAVVENGLVTNTIWLNPTTDFPNAVPCGDYPVAIGDTYENGRFYRNGEIILSPMEEMAEALAILGVA